MTLVEEFEKRKDIIKAKFSSKITSATKTNAWEDITAVINAQNPSVKRDVKEVQKKWDNICTTAKTEYACKKRLQRKTGGGPSPPDVSDLSQRVCEDSPTLAGIECGIDVEDNNDDSDEEEIIKIVKRPRKSSSLSPKQTQNDDLTELHREVLHLEKTRLNLEIEKINMEKDKLKIESEKLQIEKEKLNMEKNKLTIEIEKLSLDMQAYGVTVAIDDTS